MNYWLGYITILIVAGGGLLALLIYLRRKKLSRPVIENLVLMVLAFFLTFMAVEFYFKVFFAEPDAINSLARQNWRARYYKDAFNSLGYRDREWTDEMIAGKTKVVVVGDSFVEGLGIEYPEDRFSNLLNEKLGPEYVVFNLGDSGSSTNGQIEHLIEFPYKPDILVWSYYMDDIEGQAGLHWPDKPHIPSAQTPPPFSHSYALNFVYWRLKRVIFQTDLFDGYWDWLQRVHHDPQAWWLHQQELLSIYEGAKAESIPLLAVVFPNMGAVEESRVITDKVVSFFEAQGVPTVDVAGLVEGRSRKELMASPVDPHASELVNRLVAEQLYELLVEQGIVSRRTE